MTKARMAGAAALPLLLAGCVSVDPPDKPIDINLTVKIEQEVVVRLQQDVATLIDDNPEAFPEPLPEDTPPPADEGAAQ